MRLIKPSFEILRIMGDSLELIERAGRTCYKSDDKATLGLTRKFVESIIKRGHESVIEHSAMTVKFICDRGVTHELVRHRLCSFSQESTRYVNYKGGCTFVIPPWLNWIPEGDYLNIPSGYTLYDKAVEEGLVKYVGRTYHNDVAKGTRWIQLMQIAQNSYKDLISLGWSPQQARSVLPNSTKTEIVVTANFREWRHIFKLRCSPAAHPQMREIMIPLYKECKKLIPVIFDDIQID